ncbi:MAG: hypothetical protein IPH07_17005 [Deltaproteobacteria bacterium]|nr:hypothetical protein [Deltaproteobacteria bacterium]MBP7291218.1 hypothetical protein [Nannocystaceae bacterium]
MMPTTPRRSPLMLGLAAALSLAACEHAGKGKTEPPGETTDPVANDTAPPVEIDDSVKQEPDPPEIAQAAQRYLMGDYPGVVELLQPIYDDLKTREQYHASTMAAVWLTLAHGEQVFENGKEPSQWTASMADATEDPEIDAAANLATGSYLIGDLEFDQAAARLAKVPEQTKDPILVGLSHLMRAEALINGAFNREDESLQYPEKLDVAKAAYDAAAALAKDDDALALVYARTHEGYAALANYRKQRDQVCAEAVAAIQLFAAKGASKLLAVPTDLASANKCTLPPEASATE